MDHGGATCRPPEELMKVGVGAFARGVLGGALDDYHAVKDGGECVQCACERRGHLSPPLKFVLEEYICDGADLVHRVPLGRVCSEGENCVQLILAHFRGEVHVQPAQH
jgi:hypothetical protein